MPAKIVLLYFPIVGRAQPLRHALADGGLLFQDFRIPLGSWREQKIDNALAGPYRGLPTLQWERVTVAETLAIAFFLARRLGHYDGLDDVAIARGEAICSNAYIEAMIKIGELLWMDVLYPDVDLVRALPRPLARVIDKLERLEAQMAKSGWLAGERPTMPDFFAAEALEALRYVLGPAREQRLAARMPRLFAHAERVKAREAIAEAWKTRPERFTARPDESAMLERLHALDLLPLGF